MKIKNIILGLAATVSLVACEDQIDFETTKGPDRIVVDGWITSEYTRHQVILSENQNYTDNGSIVYINDATIILTDETTQTSDTLELEGDGVYLTDSMSAELGHLYSLRIETSSGKIYTAAPQEAFSSSTIDTALVIHDPENPFAEEGEEYYIIVGSQEPAGLGSYYKWDYYSNGEKKGDPLDIIVFDDSFVDGNYVLLDFPNYSESEGNYVKVVQHGISREAYEYYSIVREQTGFIGGMFDPPPAPIIGNIVNPDDADDYGLGYFGVSTIDTVGVYITN